MRGHWEEESYYWWTDYTMTSNPNFEERMESYCIWERLCVEDLRECIEKLEEAKEPDTVAQEVYETMMREDNDWFDELFAKEESD